MPPSATSRSAQSRSVTYAILSTLTKVSYFHDSIVSISQDAYIHFRFTGDVSFGGAMQEMEREGRESTAHSPVIAKDFLKEAKLPGPGHPSRFRSFHDVVGDPILYLYRS